MGENIAKLGKHRQKLVSGGKKRVECLFKTSHRSHRVVLVVNLDQIRDICDVVSNPRANPY